MTLSLMAPTRVPTGEVDRVLAVARAWTARAPLPVISALHRSPADISEHAFRRCTQSTAGPVRRPADPAHPRPTSRRRVMARVVFSREVGHTPATTRRDGRPEVIG